ncbi:hypothetical protein H7Y40_01325 [Pedobacter sp.]|nr:hypothetical protein [Candidatus Saccharibacteria bacterium]
MSERSPHEQEGVLMSQKDAARIQAALAEARRARATPNTPPPISFGSGRPRPAQPSTAGRRPQGIPSFQPPKPVAESRREAPGSGRSGATEYQFSETQAAEKRSKERAKKSPNPENTPRRRHARASVVGVVIVASLVTIGAAKTDVFKDLPFAGKYIEQGIGSLGDSPAAEATAIETVGAEGLTLENCQEDGSAVATITVSGRYPLKYLLKTPDGTQDLPVNKYLTEPGEVVTDSGYPELELKNFPIRLSACVKEVLDGQVIAPSGGETMIDPNQMDIKASIPTDYTSVVFNGEGSVKEISNTEPTLIWTASSYLKPDPAKFSDASVVAAEAAHTAIASEINTQAAATLNASLDAILQMAMQASSSSEMNEKCDFSGENQNTAQVVKEGISQRIVGDPDKVEFANAIENIGGVTFKKDLPILVDNPANLAERFILDSCLVVVGDPEVSMQSGEKS